MNKYFINQLWCVRVKNLQTVKNIHGLTDPYVVAEIVKILAYPEKYGYILSKNRNGYKYPDDFKSKYHRDVSNIPNAFFTFETDEDALLFYEVMKNE